MKIARRPTDPANPPAPAPPRSPNPPPHPNPFPFKSPHRPQRQRTRLRRAGAPTGKRSSRPETPLLKWKTEERDRNAVCIDVDDDDDDEVSPPEVRRRRRRRDVPVSARKLAAVLWRLNPPESVAPGGVGGCLPRRCKEEIGAGHLAVPFIGHCNGKVFGSEAKDPVQSPKPVSGTRNGFFCKLEPSFQFSNSAMEGATKWDPISLETSEEARQLYTYVKLLDRQVGAASVISSLEAELKHAQARIQELETEHRISKKKLEHFLNKVSEEKAVWRRREHEKVRVFIDDMKSELNRERKSCQRMEIVNSKLVNELAEAKLLAKRYMQDYEKERKRSEMIEEVCEDLVKEMGEDKAEFEALERESMNFQAEVEEERKMLQMAEVWREERVQMKLVDAKVALEEKYSQMNSLVVNLENFMSKLRNSNPDMKVLKEAEFLRQTAALVNIREIREFTYEPPNPDDIFAVLQEVNFAENSEREIDACDAYSPASKIRTVSPEVGVARDRKSQRYSNAFHDHGKGDIQDEESGWESVSNLEDQGSSYFPQRSGSAPSVNKNQRDSYVSESDGSETSVTGISEVCSVQSKQFNKVSSISRLWRSCPDNREKQNHKVVSVEGMNNGRLSNARWGQKDSLNAKLLEARAGSQKLQLRQVLKQKM